MILMWAYGINSIFRILMFIAAAAAKSLPSSPSKSLSRVQLFVTPWTAAHQASPSMGFSRQEYWSGAPLPSPLCSLSEP